MKNTVKEIKIWLYKTEDQVSELENKVEKNSKQSNNNNNNNNKKTQKEIRGVKGTGV